MIHDTSHNWKYSTDILQVGGRLVKEVYVGSRKVYPMGVNLMGLREIIEDDAAFYGDAGGRKYNWYVWFPNGDAYDDFMNGQHVLSARIFCDYHAPHDKSMYYGRDLDKPVGFVNWGDTQKRSGEMGEYEIPVMRIIYYYASTASKEPVEYGGFYPYIVPVNPKWLQGDGEGKYDKPGYGLIWMGWQWWLYKDSDHIFKYDFIKREFGPQLRGSDLWIPVDPDITPRN